MYELKDNERWVKDYEGRYFVNTDSEVWSTVRATPKKMVGAVLYDGVRNASTYRVFCLTDKDGVSATPYLHRIVAEAFIPNPDNKPTVNHINGKKQDNRLDNLEWATWQEQVIHAYENLKRKGSKIQILMADKPKRDDEVDSYLKQGGGLLVNCSEQYLTEEDFVRNGIPYDLYKLTGFNGKSYLDKWMVLLVIGSCIDSGKTLAVTAEITGMDQSYISLVRAGKRCKHLMDVYHKYKYVPEYVDPHLVKIRKAYNGNCK